MSKRLSVLGFAVLAVGLIVAGCGSSDDSTSSDSTTASITKAELIKQGDAICEKGNEQIESEAEDFAKENDVDTDNPKKAQQEEAIEQVVAPGVREQAQELEALGAPGGDEEQIEAIVESVETGADELEEDPGLLFGKDSPLVKGTKLAKEYGFKVCGQE